MSDLAEDSCPVRAGDVIGGKYRVERILGTGGMGVVVAAMHLELEQRVALKFLLPTGASKPDIAARFAREARAAAKIRGEHVARVIDVGTLETGSPYIVMEFMDGEDLERVLLRTGPFPVEVAVSYVLEASEAIAEAHAMGIVHRDLKPANLFLAKRPGGAPIVKVLDFGISKEMLGAPENLTTTNSALGSPHYMAPEQITAARNVDSRTDIWALGVVLYELLAGQPPFPSHTMPELVGKILQVEPVPMSMLRGDVPPGLTQVLDRCLQKNPANRFQNVAELAAALGPYGSTRSELSVERISSVLGLSSASMQRPVVDSAPDTERAFPRVVIAATAPAVRAETPSLSMTESQWTERVATDPEADTSRKTALLIGVPVFLGVFIAIGLGVVLLRDSTPPGAQSAASTSRAPTATSSRTCSASWPRRSRRW